jgi:hypothetical protein
MKLSSLFMALAMSSTAWVQAQTFVSTTPSNRNVILEEFTGMYCTFCPDGHVRANAITTNNPGRAWAINIHSGYLAEPNPGAPDFRTSIGDAIDGYFQVNDTAGYPAGAVNRFNANDGEAVIAGRGRWTARTTTQIGQASPVNVAARCTFDLDTRQLTMTVETYYTANGVGSTDRLNAFILQNNVEGPQTGAATYNPSQILPNGNYNHMHMLRHSLTGTWGVILNATAMGSFHSNQFTYTVPANYTGVPANLTDLEVVAFIADDTFAIQTAAKASITYLTNTPLRVQAVNGGVSVNVAGGIFCETSANPTISVLNTGSNGITSIAGTYSVNGGAAVPFTHSPAAAVNTGGTITFDVTNVPMPNTGANTVVFTIDNLNGQAVTTPAMNLTLNRASNITSSVDSVRFDITFDNWPSETTWAFVNETTGATVASGGPYARPADNLTSRVFMLPVVDGNCYRMEILDTEGDGICCAYGAGSLSVTLGSNTLLSNASFGVSAASKFNYSRVVGITRAEEAANNVRLYPNPTSSNLTIEFDLAQEADMNIEITNTLGQVVGKIANGNTAAGFHSLQVSTANLSSGTYFVRFLDGNKATAQRFTVIR